MPIADTNILFTRKHPFYAANEATWRRSMAAYGGGAKYIALALVKHMSEVAPEFQERLARAFYVNYPRRIATLITQYVLSERPQREGADSDIVEDFDRSGLRVDEVMRQFSTYLNICGCAWLACDMPSFDGFKTKADELAERLRPYAVALSPLQVVDWCYANDGQLAWVLVDENRWDNSDPFEQGSNVRIRKLWTRNDVTTIAYNDRTGTKTESVLYHNLGAVPFVRHVEADGYGIGENHWFEDAVRISDAILNASSEAQMNIVKQMFGLLVIPEDFLETIRAQKETENNGDASANQPLSHILARSAALFESAEGKGCSRYISPSGTETAVIRSEIDAMKRELYSVVGLSASKDTKMVESAEAKEWDFQNVAHYMQTRADILEQCELQAWKFLNMWQPSIGVPKISYNRNFVILDFKEAVGTLLQLADFNQDNDAYQKEIAKTALVILGRMRQLPQKTVDEALAAIDQSTPGEDYRHQQEMLRTMQTDVDTGGNGME